MKKQKQQQISPVITFFLLGYNQSLPWYILLYTISFYQQVLENENLVYFFPIPLLSGSSFACFIVTYIKNQILSKKAIIIILVLIQIVLIAQIISVHFIEDTFQFLIIMISSLFINGILVQLMMSSIMQVSQYFTKKSQNSFNISVRFSGILTGLFRIFCQFIYPKDEEHLISFNCITLYYFSNVGIILLTLIMVIFVVKQKYFQQQLNIIQDQNDIYDKSTVSRPALLRSQYGYSYIENRKMIESADDNSQILVSSLIVGKNENIENQQLIEKNKRNNSLNENNKQKFKSKRYKNIEEIQKNTNSQNSNFNNSVPFYSNLDFKNQSVMGNSDSNISYKSDSIEDDESLQIYQNQNQHQNSSFSKNQSKFSSNYTNKNKNKNLQKTSSNPTKSQNQSKHQYYFRNKNPQDEIEKQNSKLQQENQDFQNFNQSQIDVYQNQLSYKETQNQNKNSISEDFAQDLLQFEDEEEDEISLQNELFFQSMVQLSNKISFMTTMKPNAATNNNKDIQEPLNPQQSNTSKSSELNQKKLKSPLNKAKQKSNQGKKLIKVKKKSKFLKLFQTSYKTRHLPGLILLFCIQNFFLYPSQTIFGLGGLNEKKKQLEFYEQYGIIILVLLSILGTTLGRYIGTLHKIFQSYIFIYLFLVTRLLALLLYRMYFISDEYLNICKILLFYFWAFLYQFLGNLGIVGCYLKGQNYLNNNAKEIFLFNLLGVYLENIGSALGSILSLIFLI